MNRTSTLVWAAIALLAILLAAIVGLVVVDADGTRTTPIITTLGLAVAALVPSVVVMFRQDSMHNDVQEIKGNVNGQLREAVTEHVVAQAAPVVKEVAIEEVRRVIRDAGNGKHQGGPR